MRRGLRREKRNTMRCSSSQHYSRIATLVMFAASVVFFIGSNYSLLSQYQNSFGRRNLRLTTADTVKYYTQDDIMKTSPYFQKFVPRLLVFDGTKFQAYGLAHRETQYFETMRYTYRYIDTIPLLVQALKENFPDRFMPGMPPFELLLSDADSPHSDCVNIKCPTSDFAPMILFGSTLKDDSIFPTLRSFPHPVFTHCLFHYKVNGVEKCDWPQKPRTDIPWDSLIDTVVWRGADWPFLHYHNRFRFEGPNDILQRMETPEWKNGDPKTILQDLSTNLMDKFSPRWRGAIMSARAATDAVPWIDTKFVGGVNAEIHTMLSKLGVNVTGDRMDADVMSNYKYQIDYGGGGGTTWEGTLTKLLMPGVLFHHETETKDWYYDMMIPWKHYVPIKWDLSDLWSTFSGAQSHQEQMKQISAEGKRLAEYMMTADYMEEVYQELFVRYLGKLVHSYQPPTDGSTWAEMQTKYDTHGFDLYNIAMCRDKVCAVQCRKGVKEQVLFINGDKPVGTRAATAQQYPPPPEQQQQQPQWQQSPPQQQQQEQQPQQALGQPQQLQPPVQQQWQQSPPQQQQQPQQVLGQPQLLQPPAQQQWQQSPPLQQQPQQVLGTAQLWQPLVPANQIPLQQQWQQASTLQQQQPQQQQLTIPETPLSPQKPPQQLDVAPHRFATSEAKPVEAAAAERKLDAGSQRADGPLAKEDEPIADKAFAYIAGMTSPPPTPTPIPTEPPVPDRSSMYIAAVVPKPGLRAD